MVLAAVLGGSFVNELAIINGDAIQTAFVADFLRYSLALLALLMIATSVAEDYEFSQFERLLTMPLARWQYIAAQALVIACLPSGVRQASIPPSHCGTTGRWKNMAWK